MSSPRIHRRSILGAAALGAAWPLASAGASASTSSKALTRGGADICPGPFKPEWDSLVSQYQTPDWFRDAKFGLWAHWGAQCVPENGDWYAREMYMQGHPHYKHHLKHYGHPADTGFMQMYPRWQAQAWDPEALIDLYVRAGAKYFVSMANHHDNFDHYDSRFHDWNSVRIGPRRDIVGEWAKAVRARGLKFGVSNHSAHAWHWFQTAYGCDAEGPRRGQRYDAWHLTRFDGQGTWWEGLDPQALYGQPVMPLPDGLASAAEAAAWHEKNDRVWDERPPLVNPAFTRQWYLRCKDLIDRYEPDLVYFDNFDLPLGQVGLDIAAHYYNASRQRHGSVQAVINAKMIAPERRQALVEDVERGMRADIAPQAWQTCTCIGQWHYDRSLYLNRAYRSAPDVIHRLCDIVAKNGNLLLSVPMRADGTIDDEERRIVEEIGAWMSRFGDALYGTRPWRLAGEGPTEVKAGMFGEGEQRPFGARDIRFTTKAGAVYAICLGVPEDGQLNIQALRRGASGEVQRVEVVGRPQALSFQRSERGLQVTLPKDGLHPFGVAVKIMGSGGLE